MTILSAENREYVTVKEFVSLTGISLSTVRRYLTDRRLPSIQPGGSRCRVLIPRDALSRFTNPRIEGGEPQSPGNSTSRKAAKRGKPVAGLAGPKPRWLKNS